MFFFVFFSGPLELCPLEGYADGKNNFTVALFESIQFSVCFQSPTGTSPKVLEVIPDAGNDSRISSTTLSTSEHTRTFRTFQTKVSKKPDQTSRYTTSFCREILVWTYAQTVINFYYFSMFLNKLQIFKLIQSRSFLEYAIHPVNHFNERINNSVNQSIFLTNQSNFQELGGGESDNHTARWLGLVENVGCRRGRQRWM